MSQINPSGPTWPACCMYLVQMVAVKVLGTMNGNVISEVMRTTLTFLFLGHVDILAFLDSFALSIFISKRLLNSASSCLIFANYQAQTCNQCVLKSSEKYIFEGGWSSSPNRELWRGCA